MTGIYKIENLINRKVYIGQSVNIEQRLKKHFTNYKKLKGSEVGKPLYRSMRKYGIENFKTEVVFETDDVSVLNEMEVYYIGFYCSNYKDFGYNLNLNGNVSTLCKLTNVEVLEIVEELKGSKTKKEISKKFGISVQHINNINRGSCLKIKDECYPIRKFYDSTIGKNKKKRTIIKCKVCKSETKNDKFCSIACSSVNQRIVERPSKEELLNLLKENSFVSVGKMFNVSDNCIRKWIK